MEAASRHQCMRDLPKLSQCGIEMEPRNLWTTVQERRDVDKKRERERQGQGGSMRREEIHSESWAE